MAASHRGIALLIANSSYSHLGDLDNALNDASAMSCRLESCDYEVLSAINLDIDEIKAKISNLKRRLAVSQHREVLIYYAGHGLAHNNEHYIAGGAFNDEAQLLDNEINLNCLSVDSDIVDSICVIRVPEGKTRSLVVILDACYKSFNPLDKRMASGGRLLPQLKSRHETRIGVLVCYSYALGLGVRDSGKHGLYTDCLIQNIFEPGKSIVDAISIANRMAIKLVEVEQQPVMQVNFADFFQYPLLQAKDAYNFESPTLQEKNQMLQQQIENLRTKIKSQEEGALATDEPPRMRDHDNELLKIEHEKLKLEKEKFEQEFQLMKLEFEKFRLENSKKEEQMSNNEIMEKIYELADRRLWTKIKNRLSRRPSTCTSEFKEANGSITYIYLRENNLKGLIPSELGRLSGLTYLNLYRNRLKGPIPVELGKLKNLVHLYLGGNQLTGVIPMELGELKNLMHLYLGGNKLTGVIPMELGKLKNLVHLYLGGNQLTGEIPKELGELRELKHLGLHSNQLKGKIPKELEELSELKWLYLSGNQLTGGPPIIAECNIIFHPQSGKQDDEHFVANGQASKISEQF